MRWPCPDCGGSSISCLCLCYGRPRERIEARRAETPKSGSVGDESRAEGLAQ